MNISGTESWNWIEFGEGICQFFRQIYPRNPAGFFGMYPGVWTLHSVKDSETETGGKILRCVSLFWLCESRLKMVSAQNCVTISVICWSSLTVWGWQPRVVQVDVQVFWTRCAHRLPWMQPWMRWIESMSCSDAISTTHLTTLRPATSNLSYRLLMCVYTQNFLLSFYRVAQNKIPHRRTCNISATSALILKILEAA